MVKLLDSVVTLSKNHIGNFTVNVLNVHAISVSKRLIAFLKKLILVDSLVMAKYCRSIIINLLIVLPRDLIKFQFHRRVKAGHDLECKICVHK